MTDLNYSTNRHHRHDELQISPLGLAMVAAMFRLIDRLALRVLSSVRAVRFKSMYPGLSIGSGTILKRGVELHVLNGAMLSLGENVMLEAGVQIQSEGTLIIGDNGFVGAGTMIVAAERIEIGADALIAERVTIRDQDHVTSDPSRPYRQQGKTTSPITIGSNVWLGAGVAVLKGVTIGRDCVVGANSVVSRSLSEGIRAVGSPARPFS